MGTTTFTVNREKLKVVIERVFDAPPENVWSVITDPKRIPEWWGPSCFNTVVEEMDVRVGGKWRFIQRGAKGSEFEGQTHVFSGVYREIDPPRRLSQTFNYEPIGPGHEIFETMILEATTDGKTRAMSTAVYQTIEDFDGMVGAGMESGVRETWDNLARLVEAA